MEAVTTVRSIGVSIFNTREVFSHTREVSTDSFDLV